MSDTRQLRWVASRWKEMSGDWQMEVAQPSWDLTEDRRGPEKSDQGWSDSRLGEKTIGLMGTRNVLL